MRLFADAYQDRSDFVRGGWRMNVKIRLDKGTDAARWSNLFVELECLVSSIVTPFSFKNNARDELKSKERGMRWN
jgi:hypothetical protein